MGRRAAAGAGFTNPKPKPQTLMGTEDGLGTPLLVHWAGAQLQVRAPQTLNPNPKASWARRTAWARRCWCTLWAGAQLQVPAHKPSTLIPHMHAARYRLRGRCLHTNPKSLFHTCMPHAAGCVRVCELALHGTCEQCLGVARHNLLSQARTQRLASSWQVLACSRGAAQSRQAC